MLVSLLNLKACAAILILVDISFSMSPSAEMKLPRYLKSLISSSISPLSLTGVFFVLLLCDFSFMGLVLVGCILRPAVSAMLPTVHFLLHVILGVEEEANIVSEACIF